MKQKIRSGRALAAIISAALAVTGILTAAGCKQQQGTEHGRTEATESASVPAASDLTSAATPGFGDEATGMPSEDPAVEPQITPTYSETGKPFEETAAPETEPAAETAATEPAEQTAAETVGTPVKEPEPTTTATPAPTPTQKPTAVPTAVPTETPTPKSTEAPPTVDPANIDMNAAVKRGILSYFSNPRYCNAKENAGTGGSTVLLTTANVTGPDSCTPYIFFRYKAFCDSIGIKAVNLAEKPYVLLKVRTGGLHDRIASLLGAVTLADTENTRTEVFVPVEETEDWQYICFDLTGASAADKLSMLRLTFEQFAGGSGETLEIAEIRFLTAAEAAPYIKPDVYGIGEQSGEGLFLKVLQFNIQTENGNASPFRTRADMYRRLVDELQPDVVGMEEVTVNWFKWLDACVFNESYARIGEARTPGGEANPIYYRKDKFDLVDGGTFWLSDTPDVVGSAFEAANYPRICTWVVLRDKATGIEFAHMNTHLDHNGKNNSTDGNNLRKEQMKVIIRFSQRFGNMPMFLTGDLNNRRTTSAGKLYALYKMITGKSTVTDEEGNEYTMTLADSRIDAPVTVDENHLATMTANYNESSASYNPGKEPIDYVFYNPANTDPLSYETFLISRNGQEISDHLPVFTTFRINP